MTTTHEGASNPLELTSIAPTSTYEPDSHTPIPHATASAIQSRVDKATRRDLDIYTTPQHAEQ
jgi:hypothetical protein